MNQIHSVGEQGTTSSLGEFNNLNLPQEQYTFLIGSAADRTAHNGCPID
jgi:hypothetical protein